MGQVAEADATRNLIQRASSYGAFKGPVGADPSGVAIWIWRDALADDALARCFSDAGWPLALLEGLPPGPQWRWSKLVHGRDSLVRAHDSFSIEAACGRDGRQPRGNVRLTLHLRGYDDDDREKGGLHWWRAKRRDVRGACGLGHHLVGKLIDALAEVEAAGGSLFVEQLVIVLNKDASRPLQTIVPKLHVDESYGPREACIASLIEEGWSANGGTLLLPKRRMSDFAPGRLLTLDALERDEGQTLIRSRSGDILIYDGMRLADGQPDTAHVLPHISADVAGRSSRLAILMRHRPAALL